MDQLVSERLRDNLSRLKLIRAPEVLETVVTTAEQEQSSYLTFLDHLLEEEVAAKEQRRIQTAMKRGQPWKTKPSWNDCNRAASLTVIQRSYSGWIHSERSRCICARIV